MGDTGEQGLSAKCRLVIAMLQNTKIAWLEAHTHMTESVKCKPEGLKISYVVGILLRKCQTRTETCA